MNNISHLGSFSLSNYPNPEIRRDSTKKRGVFHTAFLVLVLALGIFSSAFAHASPEHSSRKFEVLPSSRTLSTFREQAGGSVYFPTPPSIDEFRAQHKTTTNHFMECLGNSQYLVVQNRYIQNVTLVSAIANSFPKKPRAIVDIDNLMNALKRHTVEHLAVLDFFLKPEAIELLAFPASQVFNGFRRKGTVYLVAPYHIDVRKIPHHTNIRRIVHKNVVDFSIEQGNEEKFALLSNGMKEQWRFRVEWEKHSDDFYSWLKRNADEEKPDGTYRIHYSQLIPIKIGSSQLYVWHNKEGQRLFLVKPMREPPICFIHHDPFSLRAPSNPKLLGGPCHSAIREAIASKVAEFIGTSDVVPKTVLAILESKSFYPLLGYQRLCAVQEFVENALMLDLLKQSSLNQQDVEKAMIFLWVLGDPDADSGSFLVLPEGRIKKVDNDKGLPFKNGKPPNSNALVFHPSTRKPLSEQGYAKIEALPVEALVDLLKRYGLEDAIVALKERIAILQEVARKPGISLREIDRKFTLS